MGNDDLNRVLTREEIEQILANSDPASEWTPLLLLLLSVALFLGVWYLKRMPIDWWNRAFDWLFALFFQLFYFVVIVLLAIIPAWIIYRLIQIL